MDAASVTARHFVNRLTLTECHVRRTSAYLVYAPYGRDLNVVRDLNLPPSPNECRRAWSARQLQPSSERHCGLLDTSPVATAGNERSSGGQLR